MSQAAKGYGVVALVVVVVLVVVFMAMCLRSMVRSVNRACDELELEAQRRAERCRRSHGARR